MKKIMSLCWVMVCASLIGTSSIAHELVKVVKNTVHSSQYFIELPSSILHINDINLESAEGKKIASAIVLHCLELSKSHNDADFTLHISCKKDRIVITVTFYSRSTLLGSQSCDFCDRKKFSGAIMSENNTTIAFEKSRPARDPINFLIVPKKHVINYKDKNFKPEIFINQLAMAQELSQKLTDRRLDLYVDNGSNAAQSVMHSHMHFHSPAQWK